MTCYLKPGSSHQHILAFKKEMNPKFAKMELCISAVMMTTPIHCLPIHLKWVKAPELSGHRTALQEAE
jgi:hypothetical protein